MYNYKDLKEAIENYVYGQMTFEEVVNILNLVPIEELRNLVTRDYVAERINMRNIRENVT